MLQMTCRLGWMTYTLYLRCGCAVHVRLSARTRSAPIRLLTKRASGCRDLRHVAGMRIWLWEMLPLRESIQQKLRALRKTA